MISCTQKSTNIRVSMTYAPDITNSLKHVFEECGMELVYKNKNKMSELLGSTKDKKDCLSKAGIYRIHCNECDATYIGMTKRDIFTRMGEHTKYVEKGQTEKSAFAAHAVENNHLAVSHENVELVKSVYDERRLDAYECVYIKRERTKVNIDNGNINSVLFSLV